LDGSNRFDPNRVIHPMTIAVDWGNSSLKAGWFADDRLLHLARFDTPAGLLAALRDRPARRGIVCSTNRPADDVLTLADQTGTNWLTFSSETPVPIGNAYDTPRTLGADRLAAAVGATVLYPGRNCLILDAGTCLTADFVSADGVFRGGLILPGLQLQLRAMHEFTARLPLVSVEPGETLSLTATNTRQAMLAGVVLGMALALNGLAETYRTHHPDLAVLLCGGDGPGLESRLKEPIFAVPDLVLCGLNRILQYNVRQ
jgi:type III pantothenate kinase